MGVSRVTVAAGLAVLAAGTVLTFFLCSSSPAGPSPPSSEVGRGGAAASPPGDDAPARRARAHPATPRSAAGARRPERPSRNPQEGASERAAPLAERAEAELAGGDFLTAEDLADRCLAIDPTHERCQRVRLRSLIRAGHHQVARPLLVECLERDPNDVHCLGGMIAAHLSVREVAEAGALAERLAGLDPDSMGTHFALANVLEARGKHDEAVPHYEAACTQGQPVACRRAGSPAAD